MTASTASTISSTPTTSEPVENVLSPTPLQQLATWLGPPRPYVLTRWLILRLFALVYVFAFLGILLQGPALLGDHGLLPIANHVADLRADGQTFWDVPSLFMLDTSDGALVGWAVVGLVLSLAMLAGYANLPSLLVLWAIYGSYARVGQIWFAFGWEIQTLETTLLCAFLVHPWDPRPLRAPAPPVASIVLLRWLVFRIFLGAGLIKWRGDACWRDLTCLDVHFETQPIPNPASTLFHHAPHVVLAAGTLINHYVELVLPWCVFGPRIVRLYAACWMLAFQLALIVSGNLAFLNWLTLVPVLALFDDDFLLRFVPRRPRAWLTRETPRPAGRGHRIAVACFATVVAYKSCAVVDNLTSKHQQMNAAFDRLALVNTYGAFGSVTQTRHELVIEGTMDTNPDEATWQAYELPCKPGDPARRPCILGPYHRRLDWLIWFEAMGDAPSQPWIYHLVYKLLAGDPTIRELFATDPFDGARPRWVRIERYVYHLEPIGADTWWTREDPEEWLEPLSLDTPGFIDYLRRFHWL